MKATSVTKIRIETRVSRFIRFGREEIAFCHGCAAATRHLPVAQMAVLLALTEKATFRLVENEKLHSFETAEGSLMICTGNDLYHSSPETCEKREIGAER